MSIFKKKTQKRPYKSHLPQTLDAALERELIKRARRDPEWAFTAAKKKFGIWDSEDDDPIEKTQKRALARALEDDPDFIDQVKQRYLQEHGSSLEGDALEQRVADAAARELENNPELLSKLAKKRIDGLFESDGKLSDLVTQVREMQDLQELLGGEKKGGIGGVIDSAVISKFLEVLPALMGRASSSEIYIVENPDGTAIRMTPEQYKTYRLEKVNERKELPPGKNVSITNPHEEPTLPGQLDIVELASYIDGPPEVFVTWLSDQVEKDDNNAKFALAILYSKTIDELYALLSPYREREDVGPSIQKLEQNQAWVESVLQLVKEKDAVTQS